MLSLIWIQTIWHFDGTHFFKQLCGIQFYKLRKLKEFCDCYPLFVLALL